MKNNVNDYLKQLDWRVNENANNGDPTPSGLMLYLANKEIAEHMLENVYPEEISNLHKDADIHIHDLGFGSVVYSFYGKNVLLIKHNNEIKFETFENLFDNYIGKTEIKDGNEIKYLENVYVEDYNTEWTKLIRVIRHEKQEEFIEVVSKNGNNVIVTENHPFFIAGNYEDICPNCQNKRYITKYTSDYYRRLQCKECNVKYNVKIEPDEISETIIKSKAIDSNFAFYKKHKHIKQSTDLGYIMGMFLAEGFINSYSNDNVSICQNNNEIKKYLYNFLDGNFRVNEKVIVSTNKEYLRLFKKCGHLSQNKKIPFLYENNTMGDILSGIIDGDGTISVRDNCLSISIRMTSYTLLQQLQSWLDSINVKSSLRSIKTYENINTKIISKLPLFSLNLTLTKDLFYLLNKSYKINNTEEPYNFRKNISPKEFPVVNTKEFYVNKVEEKYVYDITTDSTSFLINGIKVHNCCGWSLEQLIREGINKVKGKASSHPAKHLSSLMIQIVNFLGVMQMEAAGAEAFNNVDTYLAPFVKIDNLPYETVKQYMQQLVFNLNIPSRWGCLSDDTEILTKNGWKYYDEVTDNELISTFNIEKNCMEYKPIQKMNVYDYAGELINFKNRKIDILMTPNHRNVIRKFNSNEYLIKQADELYDYKSPLDIPLSAPLNEGIETESDDMVKLVAWIIAEGYIPKNKGQKDSRITIKQSEKHNSKYCDEIREVLNKCNIVFHEKKAKSGFTGEDSCTSFILNRIDSRKLNDILDKHHIPKSIMNSTIKQKELFIDTYVKADGWIEENRKKISTTSKTLKNDLMQIILETGHGVGCYFKPLEKCSSYSTKPQYIITIYIKNHATITQKNKVQYTGKVWCPTVENGTFIARRKGTSFITGNSQAPFTNFTFDIKCPKDMENKKAIVGGKEQSFTYGDCQAEMDLINIAFMEVMEEGDADGQVHTFPIPTYNIDKNFDWNSKVTDKLFQMTSKYGIPYFANYVNSDMEASDIRSMCPLTKDTRVPFKIDDNKYKCTSIENIYKDYVDNPDLKVWTNMGWRKAKPVKTPMTKVFEITLNGDIKVKMGENHLQPVLNAGVIPAKHLIIGDFLPFSRKPFREKYLYEYRKITDITEVECKDDGLYCFEVDSEDHLFMLESGLMTHNCRLRLDLSELRKRGGGFFGSGDLTGSVGVVSINLPRLGYTAWDKEDFYKKLDYLLDMAKESLDIKRKEINKMLEKGYMPYMKRYLKDGFKNHFSTIGIVGMNECCINLIDEPISSEKGNKFANEVMDHINKRFSDYQINSKDRILYNLEATPAEGTSYRFAKHDKEKYIGIKTANDEGTPYYTNSSQLPVGFTDDIFAMLELQDELQSKYTSGTVQHLYLGEQIENPEVTKELVKKIFTNYKLPYISITPTFSTCIEHGYINGEVKDCPKCGKETLIWSRVVGYLRPTSAYNIGKKQEFKDRKYYEVE